MDQNELVSKYIDGSITQEELLAAIDSGKITKDEVAQFGLFLSSLERADREQTIDFLKKLNESNSSKPKKAMSKILPLLAFLILGILGLWLYSSMDTQKEPEPFDVSLFAYAYPSEDNSRSMSEDQIIKSEVGLKAENLYSSKNYVDYLQYVKSQNIINASPKFHLYTISSLIQLGDFSQVLDLANKELCKEIKCRNNIDWYKAIASIGNNDYTQGLSILKTIRKDNDHLFNSDANKLISELEKYITNLK